MDFETEQEAARGLLGEACQILSACTVEFAIVGGWRPFLFNNQPIPHPGTFDVDVLLRETTPRAAFDAAATSLLTRGYMRAPKNQFQAHRVLSVRGESLVYHVDFLHRKYAPDTGDLVMEWGKFQSIAGPGTDVIFVHDEYVVETVDVRLPTGDSASVHIPLASEVGILATKGRSASTAKRQRDPFDIYLVVKQSRDRTHLIARCRELLGSALFRLSLEEIQKGFSGEAWLANAARYLLSANPTESDAIGEIRMVMHQFFEDIGIVSRR